MYRQTAWRRARRFPVRRMMAPGTACTVAAATLGATALLGLAPACASALQSTVLGAWGNNLSNGLGDIGDVQTPTQVATAGVSDATAASTGQDSSLILTPEGVYVTGDVNDNGLGSNAALPTPSLIPNTAGTTAVAAGYGGNLLLDDGVVYAFGPDTDEAAGASPANTGVATPTPVPGLPDDVTAISAGYASGLALDADGHIWAWGAAETLGSATAEADGDSATAVQVPLPSDDTGARAVAIATGEDHDLALLSNGNVISWGENSNGELGTGGTGSGTESAVPAATTYDTADVLGPSGSSTPVTLPSGVSVTSVTAGSDFSIALLSNGTFESWGENALGELGLGTGSTYDVLSPETPNPNDLTPGSFPAYPAFTEIQAEGFTAFGLTASGEAYAWGGEQNGELANVGQAPEWAFPYEGTPSGLTGLGPGEGVTEIPQQITGVADVPWLTSGSAGSAQFVQTGLPLTQEPSGTGPGQSESNFFSQQLGTLSPAQTVSFTANEDTTITGLSISGPGATGVADDFLIVPEDGTPLAFPHYLPVGATYSVVLRFAPSQLGDEDATLNVYTNGLTVSVPLTGFGVTLTGTPGSAGATGPAGVGIPGPPGPAGPAGPAGKNGVITFAAKAANASVRPGRVAQLSFIIGNGTAGLLPATVLSASLPKGLHVAGRKSAAVASIVAGGRRTVTLRLHVGAGARAGVYSVRVSLEVNGETVTRIVRLRVR